VIGFIVHPIETIKAIFESWHAGQHAAEAPVIIKTTDHLSEEDIARIRKNFLDQYKHNGRSPR
jgi:hypothetical protein